MQMEKPLSKMAFLLYEKDVIVEIQVKAIFHL